MNSTTGTGIRLIAVITVLAGLFAGAVTATTNYVLQKKATEENELATLRTQTYLQYIGIDSAQNFLERAIRRRVNDERPVNELCSDIKLLETNKGILELCDKHDTERTRSTEYRLRMAMYAGTEVLARLVDYLRAKNSFYNAKERRSEKERQDAGKLHRDTFAKMLMAMRANRVKGESDNIRKLLTVICPNPGNCYGFIDTDPEHLIPADKSKVQ